VKPPSFGYLAPDTLGEVPALRSEHAGHSPGQSRCSGYEGIGRPILPDVERGA
jgi:hypothetical protein